MPGEKGKQCLGEGAKFWRSVPKLTAPPKIGLTLAFKEIDKRRSFYAGRNEKKRGFEDRTKARAIAGTWWMRQGGGVII